MAYFTLSSFYWIENNILRMSFQWQFVAGILYVEIGIVLLLCLRFIRSSWWSSFFRSSIAKSAAEYGTTIFWILASVLGVNTIFLIIYNKLL